MRFSTSIYQYADQIAEHSRGGEKIILIQLILNDFQRIFA